LFSNIRQQWLGIEGAPTVINFQASEYIRSLSSAFGLSFVSDKIGVTQVYNPKVSYAYRIANKGEWSLSMGISGGVFYRTINGSLFEAEVMNDPSVNYAVETTLSPDANVGLEMQTRSFIFGLSSTHLFSVRKPENYFLNTNHRYGYLIYKNNNSELLFYKIGLQVVNRDLLTVVEGNIFVRLKHATGLMKGPREIFDFGVSVRSSRQMSFMVGVLLSPNLRLGYAYDQNFIDNYYPNTTHEVMLEYRIFNKMASSKGECGE
jgi:type IX secretion system PorP/SprF family membrane protein